jgi:hypothetical protein
MDEEAINLAEAKIERMKAKLKDDFDKLRQERNELILRGPITNPRIMHLDAQLIQHPLTDFPLMFVIYYRVMMVGALIYELEANPEEKHKMLVSLREHHREFCNAPERIQELLRPLWMKWVDTLNNEERKLEQGHG